MEELTTLKGLEEFIKSAENLLANHPATSDNDDIEEVLEEAANVVNLAEDLGLR